MDPLSMWRERNVALTSPLPADTATFRLQQGLTKRRPIFSPFCGSNSDQFGHIVLGKVTDRTINVYAVRKGVTHSWRATFHGALVPDPAGSRLIGKIKYPMFAKVFSVFWLSIAIAGFLAAAVVACVLFARGEGQETLSALGVAGFMAGMSGFGALTMSIGYGTGRRDEAYLREWLARRLMSPEPVEQRQ